ncbi:MAG TPA: MBL fold metallo-hydrolase [Candidatus Omnitrophota bacterium]|nr:MBL fold metallo-hydrolase [Candidatus Omnitrophota bacterium]
MSVSITFCGGARTVTGSMHLIEADGERVIIDCGLFQGHRDESYRINSQFCFNPALIDAAVVSHSHIDHCGNIPNLVKRGFKNKIYATRPSRDLMDLMLLDSAKIQEEDIRFVNKINARKGLPLRAPLYTIEDAQRSLKKIRAVDYRKRFKLTPRIHCTFYDSGHILGSAIPFLGIGLSERVIKIAYAVDLGRQDIPLLADPDILSDVDYLIIESTYGGRLHKPITEAREKLAEVINRTIDRGGKVIIPAFALERTQEVVYYLGELLRQKRIKPVPIYVDSPLACNITDVFLKNSASLDSEARALIENKADPFSLSSIRYIRDAQESKKLNFDKSPMIIISTSGMCESGRVLHHLRNNIEDERNTILVVGYMAKNTLGKRIVEKNKSVKIFGESFVLKAQIEVINAFSANADKDDLIEYVAKTGGKMKKVFIVHGDIDQSEALALSLKVRGFRPYIPKKMEKVELNG